MSLISIGFITFFGLAIYFNGRFIVNPRQFLALKSRQSILLLASLVAANLALMYSVGFDPLVFVLACLPGAVAAFVFRFLDRR